MQYWLNAFSKNYANFSGRARRAEYWMFLLFQIIVFVVLALLARVASAFLYVYIVYALASLVPSLALIVRRLHDVGKSGWFYFIGLIRWSAGSGCSSCSAPRATAVRTSTARTRRPASRSKAPPETGGIPRGGRPFRRLRPRPTRGPRAAPGSRHRSGPAPRRPTRRGRR